MAYVPPHKRVSDANSFKPSPATPPAPFRSRFQPKSLPSHFRPDVIIHKSSEYIGRFIVAFEHSLRGLNLEFVKFDGESFSHLQNVALYTLQLAGDDLKKRSLGFDEEIIRGLSLRELRTPADSIVERLRADLDQMFEKFKITAPGNAIVPAMWLKFGKLLFKNESRFPFNWSEKYTSDSLEEHIRHHSVSKVFDNALNEEEYLRLLEFANHDATQTWYKDEYFIQLSDLSVPNMEIWCVCKSSPNADDSGGSSGMQRQARLQIKKVHRSAVRHMICDIACIGKMNDIRLMFYVKEHLHELSQEELQELQSCFSTARIDDNSKGGLNWMLGTDSSTSGRFKIISCFHEVSTFIIGGELKWRFQKCNRGEFKASSGRVTHEVTVRPTVYTEFRKGRRDWSSDEFILSLVRSLQRMWIQCA